MQKGKNGDSKATIDVWQVLTTFKVNLDKYKEVVLNKNNLLFLTGYEKEFLIFKTEEGLSIKFHKSILDMNKIVKIF